MLDSLEDNAKALSNDTVARAILWSLHPLDDYGIYEAAYGALRNFTPQALAQAAADVLPEWLARFGDHTSIQTALTTIAWDDEALDLLIEEGREWTTEQRSLDHGTGSRRSVEGCTGPPEPSNDPAAQ
jgi:hypothetical protein